MSNRLKTLLALPHALWYYPCNIHLLKKEKSMKNLLLCALVPLCAYAADNQTQKQPYSSLAEHMKKWEASDKSGGHITPSSFNDYGKQVFNIYVGLWVKTAKDNNIPTTQGLAKLFADMFNDGVEKVTHDYAALKKANEYDLDFQTSPSAQIESIIKNQMNPGKGGNYYFPGADEANADRLRINRQHEFYNIMYKRHESPIMPKSKLVGWYYDLGTTSALESLKLNENNASISPTAIRGITLLATYYMQQDQKKD